MSGEIGISVIMSCYNSGCYLDEAIESILVQSFRDFELILIDDFSEDDTLAICYRYKERDERIKVLALPVNSGAAFARNAGVKLANCEWIAILDSDDVAEPNRFAEQLKLAKSNSHLVLIGSNASLIDKNSRILRNYSYPTGDRVLKKRLHSMKAFPPHSSMIYRREVFHQVIGFNQRYIRSEDWDLWLRMSERGQFASVDKSLVKIRKHENNISNTDNGMLQEKYGLIAAICQILRDNGYPDPSTNKDEEVWEKFVSLVTELMTTNGVFERKKFWVENVREYRLNRNKLKGIFYFGTNMLKSGYAIRLIMDRLNNKSLAKQLFNKLNQDGCVE